MTLTADDVELVAQRVAELMRDELEALLRAHAPSSFVPGLVDAQTVAAALGVSRKFIYAHALELGGRQLVAGGPLRFDLAVALAAHSQPTAAPEPRRPRLTRRPLASDTPLLPIRGTVVNA
jgi:hypothetical protein